MSLQGKTLLITGASRGIGLAIALRAAKDGANIVIAAKTAESNPKLPGTIFTAAEEVEKAGGKALPIVCDIRFEDQVANAVSVAVEKFGGLDICVNNASAISLTGTLETEMKRFDLMLGINARGTFMVSKYCLPHLLRAANPHVLMLSPPLDMQPKWFATAAIRLAAGSDEAAKSCRTPEILADAAHAIFEKPKSFSGHFLIDDTFLAENGVTEFDHYRVDPAQDLIQDFFVPDDMTPPKGVSLKAIR
jgi:citronellol/citronellal dehydrogenase